VGDEPHPEPGEEISFETALERVEAIIGRIESGEIGLEESIRQYETGARLLKRCRDILDTAQQRIDRINLELTEQRTDTPDSETPPSDPA